MRLCLQLSPVRAGGAPPWVRARLQELRNSPSAQLPPGISHRPILCGREAAISITGTDPLCLHSRLWDSGLPQRHVNYVEGTLGAHSDPCCNVAAAGNEPGVSEATARACALINLLPIQETSCCSSPSSSLSIFLLQVSTVLCGQENTLTLGMSIFHHFTHDWLSFPSGLWFLHRGPCFILN